MRERVGALIIKDKKLLLVTAENPEHVWWTPGGKAKPGEATEDCLRREVKEELNIEIDDLEHFISYQGKHVSTGSTVLKVLYLASFKGSINAGAEVTDAGWFSKEDIEHGRIKVTEGLERKVIPKLVERELL